ncbi:MAG: energy-coupling factor transporter ATPase [Candidatus Infernicultor aquiphilus]|uniref:Energy-coupling factor transporter ATP-binding protein EcfA2 n=2 Tax=Candidatus Infernicultor aquiphilus TaxID=1805029 RepID=A0A1J5GUN9_9BACT|nr:energy-coupling factor transporter ATPase [bacterium]OIP70688.1 MAG: energy-coupling factor transporter ATPase [Candidatus Atribacteria bacterium CG2_30_33_13]PIU24700.1 MAG: energy-coupling factor transporter ATPase [Candidatus Atribacteria bacterium CG08_land_8_20_14_0_20_33_29]PIY32058.1 MAG: energy-coupling factor transporter ATPase [Candidatus Atribacteria bacterium CG_4_10_14_3_um_filter_34_13]
MFIRLENVYFTYSLGMPFETEVLKNINLEINEGEFIGLIGHTGCGKTTLIQHFNGLLKPTSGKVFVEGIDINKKGVKLKLIRQKIGLVFQYPENQLFEETIYQEVAFGPRKLGLPEEKIEKRVQEALKIVDLDYNLYAERSPFSLSGGEMRRVALASILSIRPKMLVLDEPTANLDPQGRDNILSEIKKVHRDFGMTVVLISHNMEKIAEIVKRLLVMNRGEIIMDGSPQEIFEKHANDLIKIGLGLPQVTECMYELKKRGKEVYTGVLTVDDAEKEILNRVKKINKKIKI